MPPTDFVRVAYAEPHAGRGRELLAAHPELRTLAGPQPASAWWIALLASAQVGLAIALARQPWYVWFPAAYVVGATIDHARWVLIHECSHNLVFAARLANRVAALAANLPLLPGQETYSYDGPLNRVAFNVGYHNEHHDLITIPWSRLPRVRRIAPEFYERLDAHQSWTKLLIAFIRDRHITLFSRVVRPLH